MADSKSTLKNLKVTKSGGEGFVSGDIIYMNGRTILNPTSIPREWTMGKVCRRSVAGAQRDRWAKIFFAITPEAALEILSPISHAIIVPDNAPFVLPRDNHTAAHVLWRKAKTYFELNALDDRTCTGLRLGEPRIFCHPPVGADVSKLLQLHADTVVIMAPKDIIALRELHKVGVGCGEGWNSVGAYSPDHPHHPATCSLRSAIKQYIPAPKPALSHRPRPVPTVALSSSGSRTHSPPTPLSHPPSLPRPLRAQHQPARGPIQAASRSAATRPAPQ